MAQTPSTRHPENRTPARHPFRTLRAMQEQMDRWFDQMLEPGLLGSESDLMPSSGFAPSVDVEETDREYILTFDIPGVKKEDIKIDFQNNVLTVSGERLEETEETHRKGAFRSERFFGSFQRSFTLPESVKAERIDATYNDGVLTLKVPKLAK